MATYDPETQAITGVDAREIIVDSLQTYSVKMLGVSDDDDEVLNFYNIGNRDAPYTLMDILEWYAQNNRLVKVTVEDAGPDPREAEAIRHAEEVAQQRRVALAELASQRTPGTEIYRTV